MTPNLPLPDWVPWWAQLAILILAILFGFAFLMMPFAVFGLKGRLDFLEAQLDDIHAELRMVATRLPDPDRAPPRAPVFEEMPRPASQRAPSPVQTPAPAPPADPRPDLARARPDLNRFEANQLDGARRGDAQALDPDGPASGSRFDVPPADRSRFDSPRPTPIRAEPPRSMPAVPEPRFDPPRPEGARAAERPPVPARFAATREPAPLRYNPPPEQGSPFRDAGTGDWDEDESPPARPLRATTLRDPARDRLRETDPGRGRSEPTLRWPPR